MTLLISGLRSDVSSLESDVSSLESDVSSLESELEDAMEESFIIVEEMERPECWTRDSSYDNFFNNVLGQVNELGTSFTDMYSLCILDHTTGDKVGTKEWAFIDTSDDDKVYPACVQMALAADGENACHSEYECGHSSYGGTGKIGFATQQANKLKAVFERMPSMKHWLCADIQHECIHIKMTGSGELGYTALANEVGEKMSVTEIDGYPLVDFFCVGKDELVKVRNKQFGLVPACLTWQTNKGAGQGTIPQYTCEGGVPAHGANWDDWQAAGYTERSR
eukprot:UN22534